MTSALAPALAPPRSGIAFWLAPLLLLLGAAALYTIGLDRAPQFDELYHVLAARGWLAHGDLRIAEGSYQRTGLFTLLIAACFRFLGESLAVARLPSVLAIALSVTALFLWLRMVAGTTAAWIGALLWALSPFALDSAQFARFYGLQILVFWLGAILLLAGTAGGQSAARRCLLLAGSALLLLAATYLQVTSLIGITGLGIWFLLAVLLPWLFSARVTPRLRWGLILGGLALGILVLLVAWWSGLLAELIRRWSYTPLFKERVQDQFWIYHSYLDLYYPTLWPILPILAVVALVARPRPALFLATTFAVAFLIHSFTPAKNFRYMAYAFPFLFALWGIGLGQVAAILWRFVREQVARLVAPLPWPSLRRPAAIGLTVLLALFLVGANTASIRTATQLAGITLPPDTPAADWRAAGTALGPALADAEIVLTTSELEALYFLGRYDVAVSRSRRDELTQLLDLGELDRDFRTGRPVVAEALTVARIIACYPKGLFISPTSRWRSPIQADAAVAAVIEREATPVALPPRSQMVAFAWNHPPVTPEPAECAPLRERLARLPERR